jgi:glycosyltransferase involved in cell wall biosynthesis
VLLDAYGLFRKRHPGARLAIAGDGPAREELEASAPPGVRFLGAVEGDALARLYASADVFCFPSTTDTFGQVLLEAGASGLPVVATRTGGTAELVEHRRNGLLVPPDDPEAFARALRRIATQAERRRELGNQGRIRAAARTSERSFGELWAAYRDAAGASTETLSDLVR